MWFQHEQYRNTLQELKKDNKKYVISRKSSYQGTVRTEICPDTSGLYVTRIVSWSIQGLVFARKLNFFVGV